LCDSVGTEISSDRFHKQKSEKLKNFPYGMENSVRNIRKKKSGMQIPTSNPTGIPVHISC